MVCRSCGADNPARQKFCDACGEPLSHPCPSCGEPTRPEARFCGECGASLGVSGGDAGPFPATTPPSAERRLVSVLFVDLVGFTGASEGRDPEEVRELLGRYFETAREIVGRYGGTVEKFIGDAVMAVWGTPRAHEDDAERAVRAALELVAGLDWLGVGIQARAGVLTGEAAVTLGASGQGMVAGDLVNTASRLQSAAAPGTVLVGEATMHAASGAIAFEPAGERTLRGKTSPVPAYRALRVVAYRGGGSRPDVLEAPFVDREDELRLLKDLLHSTARDARTWLVSVTGTGGIGKSRLAWELEKYADGLLESIHWHRGRSPAYGEGVTFWALGEMVRQRAGLAQTDSEETTRARVTQTVAEHVPDEEDRRWIEPALLTLLGLEPPPPGGRDALFSAWRMFFEHVARQGTTVLVFEDLQWADTGLLDFVDHVLDWSRDAPLLLVTLARPELFDRRPEWGANKRNFTVLGLDPLPDAAMRELLAGLVADLPDAAADAIVARADGVPLYVLETVRMLAGEGRLELVDGVYRAVGELGALTIPETLWSLIASRLDALDPADRSLLQDASVLGRSFTPAGLAAVAGMPEPQVEERLRSLARRELLRLERDPRSPERGQYSFVQSLVQEVGYGTLARADRRTRHLAAARFFESLEDDELAAAVATHYLDAYRLSGEGAEAEELAERARRALTAAADRASALGAHDQAISYLELVMSITTAASERAALLEEAAVEGNAAGQYAAAQRYARAAIEILEAAGDRTALSRATFHLGEALINAGLAERAIEAFESTLGQPPDAVEELGEAQARLLAGLGHAYQRHADYERALFASDRALAVAERLGLDAVAAQALVTKATALYRTGRSHEAIALLEGGLRLAAETGQITLELRARNNLATMLGEDDPRQATKVLKEGLALAEKVGDEQATLWHVAAAAYARLGLGESLGDILDLLDRYLERDLEPFDRFNLGSARIFIRAIGGEEVETEWRELSALVDPMSDAQMRAGAEATRASLALVGGELGVAFEAAMKAAEIEPGFVGGTVTQAARAALWMGDLERLRTAAELFDAAALPGKVNRVGSLVLDAGIAALEGRRDDAVSAYGEALRRLRGLGLVLGVADVGLDFVTALGPSVPEALAAAEESRQIYERLGVRAWSNRLESVRAEQSPAGAAGLRVDAAGAVSA
jgi:class 3 adenylate cyclase/predicted ATPase